MIHLEIEIENPLVNIFNLKFKSIWCFNLKISKNKSFEFDSYIDPHVLFKILFDTTLSGEDHAGPRMELNFLTLTIAPKIYDHRHWNYDKGLWYLPGEEEYKNAELG